MFALAKYFQINQIQRDDQGMYQCLARTDMESAQASTRLELAGKDNLWFPSSSRERKEKVAPRKKKTFFTFPLHQIRIRSHIRGRRVEPALPL